MKYFLSTSSGAREMQKFSFPIRKHRRLAKAKKYITRVTANMFLPLRLQVKKLQTNMMRKFFMSKFKVSCKVFSVAFSLNRNMPSDLSEFSGLKTI